MRKEGCKSKKCTVEIRLVQQPGNNILIYRVVQVIKVYRIEILVK